MKRPCAVCGDRTGSERYCFGAVHGFVCGACARSLGEALTDWMGERMRALEIERRRLARAQCHDQLELEALPVVTPRRPAWGRA